MKLHPDQKNSLKPSQQGVLLTVTSLLELQDDLLNKDGVEFFLPGRTGQDCAESLIGNMRGITPNPTQVQFLRNAKKMSMGQILAPVKNSSYSDDDNICFLTEFQNIKKLDSIDLQEEELHT